MWGPKSEIPPGSLLRVPVPGRQALPRADRQDLLQVWLESSPIGRHMGRGFSHPSSLSCLIPGLSLYGRPALGSETVGGNEEIVGSPLPL